jgi:hypothetical protein
VNTQYLSSWSHVKFATDDFLEVEFAVYAWLTQLGTFSDPCGGGTSGAANDRLAAENPSSWPAPPEK